MRWIKSGRGPALAQLFARKRASNSVPRPESARGSEAGLCATRQRSSFRSAATWSPAHAMIRTVRDDDRSVMMTSIRAQHARARTFEHRRGTILRANSSKPVSPQRRVVSPRGRGDGFPDRPRSRARAAMLTYTSRRHLGARLVCGSVGWPRPSYESVNRGAASIGPTRTRRLQPSAFDSQRKPSFRARPVPGRAPSADRDLARSMLGGK